MPFKTSSGEDAIAFTRKLKSTFESITEGDWLHAMSNQVKRVEERTDRGVDVDGNPFTPYAGDRNLSALDPNQKSQSLSSIARRAADIRLRQGHSTSKSLAKHQAAKKKAAKFPGLGAADNRGRFVSSFSPGRKSPFEGHEDNGKKTGLVDLKETGEMRDSIEIRSGYTALTSPTTQDVGLNDHPAPSLSGEYGLYDERNALLAKVHNEGTNPNIPRRHWLDNSTEDENEITQDIGQRVEARYASVIRKAGG